MALSLSHLLGLLLGVGFGLLGVLEGVNVPFCLRSAMQSKRRGERLVSLFNLQNGKHGFANKRGLRSYNISMKQCFPLKSCISCTFRCRLLFLSDSLPRALSMQVLKGGIAVVKQTLGLRGPQFCSRLNVIGPCRRRRKRRTGCVTCCLH